METELNTPDIKHLNTLLVVAGGSGGHILPALTLATDWKQERVNRRIIAITGATPLEKHIIKNNSNVIKFIVEVGKLNTTDLEVEEESEDGCLYHTIIESKKENKIKALYDKCNSDYIYIKEMYKNHITKK